MVVQGTLREQNPNVLCVRIQIFTYNKGEMSIVSFNSEQNVNKFVRQCQDMMTKSTRKSTFNYVYITKENQDKLVSFIKVMSERPNRVVLSHATIPLFKEFLCTKNDVVTEVIKVNPGINMFFNDTFTLHLDHNELLVFLIHTSISMKNRDPGTLVHELQQMLKPIGPPGPNPVTNYKRIKCYWSYLNTPFNPKMSKDLIPFVIKRMRERLYELTERYSSDPIYQQVMENIGPMLRFVRSGNGLKMLVKDLVRNVITDDDDTEDILTAEELLTRG